MTPKRNSQSVFWYSLRSCRRRTSSTALSASASSVSQGSSELSRAAKAQNRIFPVSMSFHITQSPMKL